MIFYLTYTTFGYSSLAEYQKELKVTENEIQESNVSRNTHRKTRVVTIPTSSSLLTAQIIKTTIHGAASD